MKKLNFSRYLEKEIEELLLEYLNTDLIKDLNQFEKIYGYRANNNLTSWLIVNKLFREAIEFEEKNGTSHYLEPRLRFTRDRWKSNYVDTHKVTNYEFSEMVSLFTPFHEIGTDGRGGHYYSNFFQQRNEIAHFDLDPFYVYKTPKTINSLLKVHSFNKLSNVIKKIQKELLDVIGESKIRYDESPKPYSVSMFYLRNYPTWDFFKGLHHKRPILNFKINDSDGPYSYFDVREKVATRLENHDSNYFKFDNTRALTNASVAKNLYFYFFTNQISALERLLLASKNMKGQLYHSMRETFLQVLNEDFSNFLFTQEEVEKIRGLNIEKH